MATPSFAAPRFDFDEPNLAAEAKFFSDMGWPVSVDASHQRLVVCTGEALDAFRLPRTLAEDVARRLAASLKAGPVSRDHDDRWWTFITEPCRRSEGEIPQELRAARVYAVPSGGQLVVPPVATLAWWQQPQPGQPPPPWTAVVATARQVIAGSSSTVVPLHRKARPSRPRTGSGT